MYRESSVYLCDLCDHVASNTGIHPDQGPTCDTCFFNDPELNSTEFGCNGCTKIRLCDEHFKMSFPHSTREG